MTITIQKYYGGYQRLFWTGNYYLSPLAKRFIRAVTAEHGGTLYLPPANDLPLVPGGAVFTVWNVGYHNIQVKDVGGTTVGCLQGTNREGGGVPACETNVHLISNSTANGSWKIDCNDCVDPADLTTTGTFSEPTSGGGTTTTTTTEEGDGGYQHQVQP
jgi:hypothetical protein